MRRLVKDVLLPVAVAVALAFVIQASVAKPYEIPTPSMTPTIEPGDRIIANRLVYRFRDIERGDIIVFDPPPSATRECGGEAGGGDIPFVKRVIGLPGDRVEVTPEDGTTLVNGEPFEIDGPVPDNYGGEGMTWPVVPEGKLLVLGDNRASSCDSHQWRPDPFLPEDNVIGQAEITYWPLSHLGFLN
ncbi:MAG: signal peptidase I [Thermoleophilia bacterium]